MDGESPPLLQLAARRLTSSNTASAERRRTPHHVTLCTLRLELSAARGRRRRQRGRWVGRRARGAALRPRGCHGGRAGSVRAGGSRKRSGVGSSRASPSIPAKAVPDRERTSNSVAVNSFQNGLRVRRPSALAANRRAAWEPVLVVTAKIAELAAVEVATLGIVGRRPDHVRVVRHHDEDRAVDLLAVGRRELEVERLGLPSEHLGEQRFSSCRPWRRGTTPLARSWRIPRATRCSRRSGR